MFDDDKNETSFSASYKLTSWRGARASLACQNMSAVQRKPTLEVPIVGFAPEFCMPVLFQDDNTDVARLELYNSSRTFQNSYL
jgi:hypothetical protein